MRKIFALLLLTAAFGCVSVKKKLDRGQYKQAIAQAVSKLRGKQHKSPKYVLALEEAHRYYLQSRLQEAESLERRGTGNEMQLLRLYEEIQQVQGSIAPLLPLRDKEGYQAKIELLDVSAPLSQYRNRAADQLYSTAIAQLEEARKGNRAAAREAYSRLQEMQGITTSTSHIRNLQAEAKDLGTTYLLLAPEISNKISLSRVATEHFRAFKTEQLNATWQTVHTTPHSKIQYDYDVVFALHDFVISPEKESTREYQDKKEIEEDAGSSSRNNQKIKRKVTVTADIIELYQFKEAVVQGKVILYDRKSRRDIYEQEVKAVQTFENYASTFKGDKRALSDVSARRVGGKPLPFPSNEKILNDAISRLKNEMVDKAMSQYKKL